MKTKPIPIGSRACRFVLEMPLERPDGFGGVIRTYAPGPQLWGAIEMLSGTERVRADRPEQSLTHRITLRYREGVTGAMRLTAACAASPSVPHPTGRVEARSRLSRRGDAGMTSPVLALRRAILDAAAADAELRALMGGTLRLYDEPPRGAEPVYAVFADVRATDWSTDHDRGHEQSLGIVVWSERGGARTALAVAERLDAILDGAALDLDGHRLVNLRVTELSSERDKDTGLARVALRLRAVTEVL